MAQEMDQVVPVVDSGRKWFKCPQAGCLNGFGSYSNLEKHLLGHHHVQPSYTCATCKAGPFGSHRNLGRHYWRDGCKPVAQVGLDDIPDDVFQGVFDVDDPGVEDKVESSIKKSCTVADGTAALAKLLLHLQGEFGLKDDGIDYFIKKLPYVLDMYCDVKLKQAVLNGTIDSDQYAAIYKMSCSHTMVNSFRTAYLRYNVVYPQFGYLEPDQIEMGTVAKQYVTRRGEVKEVTVACNQSVIDLRQAAEQFLALPGALDWVFQPVTDPFHGFCSDVLDSPAYREHPIVLQEAAKGLPVVALAITFDEVEVAAVKHISKEGKVACMYWSPLNLPQECRSKLESIFLLSMTQSNHIKMFGWHKCMEWLVREANALLKDGIDVCYRGEHHNLKVLVFGWPGDNLGQHQVGGFAQSFGPLVPFICRSCLMPQSEYAGTATEADVLAYARTEDAFRQDIAIVSKKLTRKQQLLLRRTKGLYRRPSIAGLDNFDIPRQLWHDVQHDLFEGISQEEMVLLLRFLLDEEYTTLPKFLAAVATFPFAHAHRCLRGFKLTMKTVRSEKTVGLGLHAAEAWYMSLYFVSIIKLAAPTFDWSSVQGRSFILLQKIQTLATSPVAMLGTPALESTADTLSKCIGKHQVLFIRAYTVAYLRPKHHFLWHLPEQMRRYGPVRWHWTMRFEGAHTVHKRSRLRNTKNISKTLCKRAGVWHTAKKVQGTIAQIPPTVLTDKRPVLVNKKQQPSGFRFQAATYRYQSAHIAGVHYRSGDIIPIVAGGGDRKPVLHMVKHIISDGCIHAIGMQRCRAPYDRDLNRYGITGLYKPMVYKQRTELHVPWPCARFELHEKTFAVLVEFPTCC
jgi:hypothetical protein